jgi:hypothetical protein
MSTLVNPHDNSENVAITNKKDLYSVTRTGTDAELEDHIRYFKYLQLRSELESGEEKDRKKINIGGSLVNISDLLPPNSEHDNERLRVLVLLNKLGPDDALVRQLQTDFGTNSIFELASEYANYSLGRTRGEQLYAILHGKNGGDSIYDGLVDSGKRTDTKKALADGSFTQGYKATRAK